MSHKDTRNEQIILAHRKYTSEGFSLLYVGLLADLFWRSVVLRQDISQYWDFALLFFAVCAYVLARTIWAGVWAYKGVRQSLVKVGVSSVAAAVIIVLLQAWQFPQTSLYHLILNGLLFFAGFAVVGLLISYLSYRKSMRF